MRRPKLRLNAEGWEITSPESNKAKPPPMIENRSGEFLAGTSDENLNLLQLRESDWAKNSLLMNCLQRNAH